MRILCVFIKQEYERFINERKPSRKLKTLTHLKCNIRCAFNSIDIEMVKNESDTEAAKPYRVYRMLAGKSLNKYIYTVKYHEIRYRISIRF